MSNCVVNIVLKFCCQGANQIESTFAAANLVVRQLERIMHGRKRFEAA